jgi:hypothetical protein
MGHKQHTTGTPMEIDNSTAHGILHANVRMKRSKAIDMRYHCFKDCIALGQLISTGLLGSLTALTTSPVG